VQINLVRVSIKYLANSGSLLLGLVCILRLPETSTIQPGHFLIVFLSFLGICSLFVCKKIPIYACFFLYFLLVDAIWVLQVDNPLYERLANNVLLFFSICFLYNFYSSNTIERLRYLLLGLTITLTIGLIFDFLRLVEIINYREYIYSGYIRSDYPRAIGLSGTSQHLLLYTIFSFGLSYSLSKFDKLSIFILIINSILSKTRAGLFIVLIYIIKLIKSNSKNYLLLINILLIITICLYLVNQYTDLFQDQLKRFADTKLIEEVLHRGIHKIINNPTYLIFGAGNVGIHYETEISSQIHNILIELFFSYGVIGLILGISYHFLIYRHFGVTVLFFVLIIGTTITWNMNIIFPLTISILLCLEKLRLQSQISID